MELEYQGTNPEYMVIALRLDTDPQVSRLRIDLSADSPRQQVLGIAAEFEQVLSPYKNKHYLWHPDAKITAALVVMMGVLAGILMGISLGRRISNKLGIPMPDNASSDSTATLLVPLLLTMLIAYLCGRFFIRT